MEAEAKSAIPSYRAYLPLNDRHVVPIEALDPDSIKASVNQIVENPEKKISHAAALSATAKLLGFEGGFDGYQKSWKHLLAFMKKHGLVERRDLIGRGEDVLVSLYLHRQAVAERLFASGLSLPERIFTGCDFDWAPYDARESRRRNTATEVWRGRELLVLLIENAARHDFSNESWRRDFQETLKVPAHATAFMARNLHEYVDPAFNLLSDALVWPRRDDGLVLKTYNQADIPRSRVAGIVAAGTETFRLFQKEIDRGELGWVDVVPYNDALIFLRGRNGAYDFVFRNLRGYLPPPRPFADNLSEQDIPTAFLANGWFAQWDYFQDNRWTDREDHEAEELFYARGGKAAAYPGGMVVKRAWAESRGMYSELKLAANRDPVDGFTAVTLADGRRLFVSSLVTIKELRTFLAETDYQKRREEVTDGLDAPNQDPPYLPATANWFDALAYARWFEQKYHRPVRLLKAAEYLQLHPGPLARSEYKPYPDDISQLDWRFAEGCVEFRLPGGRVRREWGWIEPNEEARFRQNLNWKKGAGGLAFLVDIGFGEWLFEHNGSGAAAIHTHHLRAIHDGEEVERDFMPASSWGKYRCCKIGFRLCFEGE